MINVIIPIAGKGKRFSDQGYKIPKPFLPIYENGLINMCEMVIFNISSTFGLGNVRFYILCRADQLVFMSSLAIWNNLAIVPIVSDGRGAASDLKWAKKFVNNDDPLIIANCDQFIKIKDIDQFMNRAWNNDIVVLTHEVENGPHGYIKINDDGYITQIAEKEQISNLANAGVIWFYKGKYFGVFVHQLLNNESYKVDNEYHLFSIIKLFLDYNLSNSYQSPYKIKTYPTDKYYGLGTPEEYEVNKDIVAELLKGELE